MKKIKTIRSVYKRFIKNLPKGFIYKHSNKNHFLIKKSSKNKRNLSKKKYLFKNKNKSIKRSLPYLTKK